MRMACHCTGFCSFSGKAWLPNGDVVLVVAWLYSGDAWLLIRGARVGRQTDALTDRQSMFLVPE